MESLIKKRDISFEEFKQRVLSDYKIVFKSRIASILGHKEVLTGKAKFGVFGDGKELPQLAMAQVFRDGDFRSGYYRDQTFMFALDELNYEQFFSALYAHTDLEYEPTSGGRQMNGHFATRSLNEDGSWRNLMKQKNSSADISSTAGQMARLVGLGYASKLYKELPKLASYTTFSNKGREIAFGTIGDASTSQGIFWETVNAIGVLQLPIILSIWDDNYGISVPKKHQTVKHSISKALEGFRKGEYSNGWEIFTVKGWDYTALVDVYERAEFLAREKHIPVLIHVEDLTQPQGHTTSGSHERYKSKERLEWEKEFDCLTKMREWILSFQLELDDDYVHRIATGDELKGIEEQAKKEVNEAKQTAWLRYKEEIDHDRQTAINLIENIIKELTDDFENKNELNATLQQLKYPIEVRKKVILTAVRKSLRLCIKNQKIASYHILSDWIKQYYNSQIPKYSSHLLSESEQGCTKIKEVPPKYEEERWVDGRIIIRDNFEKLLEKHHNLVIFGEDSGQLGDVNQGLEGLQKKFGELRVSDTGIREATIIGRGIGLAMRGIRPIAEIQYLDYIFYAFFVIADDLASLLYRSKGGQKAPLIIRTRGHRLEGIWHAGSPMGAMLHAFRGICILTPRNMTQAAGFYNTLLECDDPAIMIECLNGYRIKEKLPTNLGEFRTPIGQVETIRSGNDVTVLTYGSMCSIVMETSDELEKIGISVEVIDAQSLLPFDLIQDTVKSLKKTNKLVVADEDVPGGASAYLLQDVLERQNGYQYIDCKPITITAKEHRTAFSSDGDYFSKPSSDQVFESIYRIMHEYDPKRFPEFMQL